MDLMTNTSARPNIVLITVDQMRADLLGCAGHPLIQTPHIDLLARKGVRFEQAYSTTPVCIPARSIIMTGMEGHSLGVTTLQEGYRIPVKETLPYLLNQSGYQTGVVGKMHVYPERCHYGFEQMLLCEEGRLFGKNEGKPRGYDDYEHWLAEQGYTGMAFAHGMTNNDFNMSPWHLPDHTHPTEWIATEACKAIKRRDWTRPLFLWTSFTAPHPPLIPLLRDLYHYEGDDMPEPVKGDWNDRHSSFHHAKLEQFKTMTDKSTAMAYKAIYALITQIDRQVNRIIGTLREEGLLDNTWIIFTSDHGENMGDHGLWTKSNFLQGACRIPFIVTPPLRGNAAQITGPEWMPGLTSSTVVGLQDLLPTCLNIAGLTAPGHCDGVNLLPAVQQPSSKVRDNIMGEMGPIGNRTFMLCDGGWKYIWYEQDGTELLFHIEKDPDETRDQAQEKTQLRDMWRNRLAVTLTARGTDPAAKGGQLIARSPGYVMSAFERAHAVNDQLPRGLH
ncbi:MAG: arylsulfatase [Paenibacillus sp.]|jgi:arylsulfatase A-like enzyme|nr:arylsulfatase [Paenibacillus sp.]